MNNNCLQKVIIGLLLTSLFPIVINGAVKLNYSSVTIKVGEGVRITATSGNTSTFSWGLTNENTVLVVAGGGSNYYVVRAIAEGTSILECREIPLLNNVATCKITVSGYAAGYSFTSNTSEGVPVTYTVNDDSKTCYISKNAISTSTSGSITIPQYVKGMKVVEVADYAFRKCTGITSVNLPEGITKIGDNAFEGCTSLASIDLPSTVKYIGEYAFDGCTSLSSISGVSQLESIGFCAFDGTAMLQRMPAGLLYIGKVLYKYRMPSGITLTDAGIDINIKDGTTMITNMAFSDVPNGYINLTIPKTTTTIGISNNFGLSFSPRTISIDAANTVYDSRGGCNAIIEKSTNTLIAASKATTIPSSVKTIGQCAFYGYKGESIEIPNNIETIGKAAFYGSALKSVSIGSGVRSIGDDAFGRCYNLEKITVSSGNSIFDSRNNCNAVIEKSTNKLVVGCKNTVIPENIKEIGDYAFFNSYKGVTSLTLPESVVSIGNYAFGELQELKTITLGSKIRSIGNSAFIWCKALEAICLKSEYPCELGSTTFYTQDYDNITLYVPNGAMASYMFADGWNKFKNIVEGEPTPATTKGDVNGDGQVNGTDLVALTNIILGKSSKTDAADVNGDGYVNGTDYVALANIVLGRSNAKATAMAKGAIQAAATTGLSIEPFDIKAGETKEMVIDLTNPSDDITLVQFDLRLPKGLSVKQNGGEYDFDIAGRTTWRKHSLDANATNGIVRFLLASSSNATLTGTEGAVIKITIAADNSFTGGDIQLENILMVTPAEKEIKQDTYTYQVGQSQPSVASTGLSVEPFSISAGGEAEMVIDLNNPDDEITLVQFDLRLPNGLSLKQTGGEYDLDIAGRTTWRKHSLDANATNGIVRFLLASSSNATLTGTEGAVIRVTLKADNSFSGGAVKLENILLVTPAEKEIKQPDVNYTIGTTGIKGVASGNIEKDAPIYNLSGQRLDKPRKGINIIGGKKVMLK